MMLLMQQQPQLQDPAAVKAVLDVGCATGLSSLALTELFPSAHVTGVDLSPYMVAVGQFHQQQRQVGLRVEAVPCGYKLPIVECPGKAYVGHRVRGHRTVQH